MKKGKFIIACFALCFAGFNVSAQEESQQLKIVRNMIDAVNQKDAAAVKDLGETLGGGTKPALPRADILLAKEVGLWLLRKWRKQHIDKKGQLIVCSKRHREDGVVSC